MREKKQIINSLKLYVSSCCYTTYKLSIDVKKLGGLEEESIQPTVYYICNKCKNACNIEEAINR